ncbi:MAG: hypothetical protein FJ276_37590 [Planctomycetes bacterium]|nr:hypothetical protein [Planctomycetota bacterium]
MFSVSLVNPAVQLNAPVTAPRACAAAINGLEIGSHAEGMDLTVFGIWLGTYGILLDTTCGPLWQVTGTARRLRQLSVNRLPTVQLLAPSAA